MKSLFLALVVLASVNAVADSLPMVCRVRLDYERDSFKCAKWKQAKVEILATLRAKGYEPTEVDGDSEYTLRLDHWMTPKSDRSEPESIGQAVLFGNVLGRKTSLNDGLSSRSEYRLGTEESAVSLLAQSVSELPSCEEIVGRQRSLSNAQIGGEIGAQDWEDAAH